MDNKYLNISAKCLTAFLSLTLLTGGLLGTVFPALAAPGDITRVSVDSSGAQANGISFGSTISNDGGLVAFHSEANNLVTGDTNSANDIFVHDRQTGVTTLVSVATSGEQANYVSNTPRISGDGRYVAFDSQATNLVPDDSNHYAWDVFLHDRQTGETTCVSVNSSGERGNDASFNGSLSSGGRFVAFESMATNLVSGDTNGVIDVFVHDNQTGETIRASVDSAGNQANDHSNMPGISEDGRYLVFSSSATNLVSNDTNNARDIFVRDLQTGETRLVSVASNGMQVDNGAYVPAISGNGRYVVFESDATNLVSGNKFGMTHIYVHDLQTGETTRASVNSDGSQMVGRSSDAAISDDGRYVAFDYANTDNYGPALFEIYVHDRQTGATIHATANLSGGHGSSDQDASYVANLSADGRFLTFTSYASNLINGDTNGAPDIFVKDLAFPPDPSPTVSSIHPLCGESGCSYPTGPSISFSVTFSEVVTGVTADDFTLTMAGEISGASVTSVSGSGNEYIVTVSTGTGNGALRLDLVDDDSIRDQVGNPLGGEGAGNGNFTTGEEYIVDKGTPSIPSVISSLRVDFNPTSSTSVNFTVTFSEDVSGVDNTDFAPTTSGNLNGAFVASVGGSGSTYSVIVGTGSGDGGLRLDVLDDDSIVNAAGSPLGGAGAGNGAFAAGEAYVVDKTVPVVTGSLRADPNPTTVASVNFTVVFSESVTGVDAGDFFPVTSGTISGAAVSAVSGSGYLYTVSVGTGSGDGTLRLDILDNDSILDAAGQPLGGAGVGNANFTTGEAYALNRAPVNKIVETLRSNGANDGWVLESGEDSSQGGSKNANGEVFVLGDNAQDGQFRAILDFPTHYLPDNAVITRALLMIKKEGVVGTDPFTTHGDILVDIHAGAFGFFGPFPFRGLQDSDFQSPSSMDSAGMFQNNPLGGWHWAWLDSASFQRIDLDGFTQIRLRFQIEDNDDLGIDQVRFYSGDYEDQADRPRLVVEYFVR